MRDLEITDPHHHLWDLRANRYPWLSERVESRVCGEYSAIRRDYLLEDFLRDASEVDLVKSVHVQAEHDHADPVRETRWLQAVAERPESRGIPHGIVAYADLASPNAQAVLEAHRESPNVRGIRQMLHEGLVNPADPRPSPLDDPAWRRGLGLLERYGLSFDLQIYPQQAETAAAVVEAHSGTQFILTHSGQPVRQDSDGVALWRRAVRRLAEAPNLAVKISGFGMFNRRWSVESVRPFVLTLIESFGVERTMFASNFPVDSMAKGYGELWSAFDQITSHFRAEERRRLFSLNARRIYRV